MPRADQVSEPNCHICGEPIGTEPDVCLHKEPECAAGRVQKCGCDRGENNRAHRRCAAYVGVQVVL